MLRSINQAKKLLLSYWEKIKIQSPMTSLMNPAYDDFTCSKTEG